MRRTALVALVALQLPALADRAVVATSGLTPGTYRGPGYITRFDHDGRWTTGEPTPASTGRYSVDGDLVVFKTQQPPCPDERVRYRMTPTDDGFRLHFLDDSCKRVTQMADIVFVRMR